MPLALGVPGIGPLLIVLAVVIIVFGPKRLPALARQLGRGLSEFRKSVGADDDDEQLDEGEPVADRRPADRRPDVERRGDADVEDAPPHPDDVPRTPRR